MREPILFVAYSFPPKAGISVKRSLNFSNHLLEFGYNPIILTIDKETVLSQNGKIDGELLKNVKSENIIRVRDLYISSIFKFLTKIKVYRFFWFLFYPVFWEFSSLFPIIANKKAIKVIKENDIKKVYVSCGPFSPALLGVRLKNKCNVKLIIDFRDPLSDGYQWEYPSKLHWYYSKFIEKYIIKNTDILIVNSPEVKKLYELKYPQWARKIRVITNGY